MKLKILGLIPSGVAKDPLPIHRPTRLTIKNNMWWKSGFRVLEILSLMRNDFFWSRHLLFIFNFEMGKIKNKNPSITLVRKKRPTKLDFWVQGSSYLSRRYLIRGSTPLSSKFGLYQWIGYTGAYGLKISQSPLPPGYKDDKTHSILVGIQHA